MGITQHTTGVDNVKSVANLQMLTGNIGRPGTGVCALRGQNNVQGACDMGALPNVYSGYQAVTVPENKKKMTDAWGSELAEGKVGYTVTDLINVLADKPGTVKCLYIMGENPMLSDPDLHHVEKGLKNLEFLVVQDIFLSETAELANVVLPAACFAEKDGTQTNTERRVQKWRKAVNPPGEAKADWQIICELAAKMGFAKQFPYKSAEEIFTEIAKVTPSYGGMTYARLEKPEALHWPCPTAEHPGTPILHKEKFAHPDGLGVFTPLEWKPPAEVPDKEYPLILTTGRCIWQWHTGTMTRRSESLEREVPTGWVEINTGGCGSPRGRRRRDGQGEDEARGDRNPGQSDGRDQEGRDLHPVPLRRVRGEYPHEQRPRPCREDPGVQGLCRQDRETRRCVNGSKGRDVLYLVGRQGHPGKGRAGRRRNHAPQVRPREQDRGRRPRHQEGEGPVRCPAGARHRPEGPREHRRFPPLRDPAHVQAWSRSTSTGPRRCAWASR